MGSLGDGNNLFTVIDVQLCEEIKDQLCHSECLPLYVYVSLSVCLLHTFLIYL